MAYRQPKIVQHSLMKTMLHYVIYLLLLGVVSWQSYEWGKKQNMSTHTKTNQRIINMEERILQLQAENSKLLKNIIGLDQNSKIDKDAIKEISVQYEVLRDDNVKLKEELAFYQSIVSPQKEKIGLNIHSLKISYRSEQKKYQYNLILTQANEKIRNAYGEIVMEMNGLRSGQPVTLLMNEITGKKKDVFKYNFRYFQRFEGFYTIPNNFEPKNIKVRMKPHKSKKEIARQFKWPFNNKDKNIEVSDNEKYQFVQE